MSKVVILAGGKGLRFGEETKKKPKPLINVGPSPLIWYIMNHYSNYNLKDFIVLAGYRYLNFVKEFKKKKYSNWKIDLINTGLNTETGGRLLKAKNNILNNTRDRHFFLTYGDGLSNVNISNTLKIFKKKTPIGLVTIVKPPARFGLVKIDKNQKVISFKEKYKKDSGWINGGFFIFDKNIFNFISKKNNTVFEKKPLENLVKKRRLIAYKHKSFWQCCDNQKDLDILNLMFKKKLNIFSRTKIFRN
jgi:glucose-1-phosphate cytidylyltransferase